jgi:hypothetical protein
MPSFQKMAESGGQQMDSRMVFVSALFMVFGGLHHGVHHGK